MDWALDTSSLTRSSCIYGRMLGGEDTGMCLRSSPKNEEDMGRMIVDVEDVPGGSIDPNM